MGKRTNPSDYIGKKFNRLLIIDIIKGLKKRTSAICKCDCGNTKEIVLSSVTLGLTKSCGCYHNEQTGNVARTHGQSKTQIYKVWHAMIERCNDKNNHAYHKYGGRGISVCESWMHFENFIADMGQRPFKGAQIDRIDTYGNYEPTNCRWVTSQQNNRNRRDSLYVEFEGKQILLKELAEQYRVEYKTLFARIKYHGMTVEEAIILPVTGNGKNVMMYKKQQTPAPQTTLEVE